MSSPNYIRETLANGGTVIGARCKTQSPMFIEIYGDLGMDFAWMDFEHGGPSPEDSTVFEHYTRAAETSDVELLVRLPSGDPSLVRKVLDAGIRTVLIPRIETAEEVREAVKATRFVYDGAPGERGFAAGRANRWGADLDEYIRRADESVLMGVQIEHRNAVENLDEILSVSELGFVFIGYGDLSISLGHPLDLDHPTVRDTIEDVRDRCQEANIPVGYTVDTTEDATAALEEGFKLVRVGDEVSSTRNVLGERMERLRK